VNCFFTDRFQCNLLPHLHLPVYCGCFVGYGTSQQSVSKKTIQDIGGQVYLPHFPAVGNVGLRVQETLQLKPGFSAPVLFKVFNRHTLLPSGTGVPP
jgi:hypothetical protein